MGKDGVSPKTRKKVLKREEIREHKGKESRKEGDQEGKQRGRKNIIHKQVEGKKKERIELKKNM